MTKNDVTIRFSHLRAMGRSPAHARLAIFGDDNRQTPAMALGTALHATYEGRTVVAYPGPVRRGKSWDDFRDAHAGDIIVTGKEAAQVDGMRAAIAKSAIATRLMTGTREETLFFDHLGMRCRATPDVVGDGWLVDLKSTNTSDPNRFGAHALRLAYHAQLAWYRQAVATASGTAPARVYIVAVENTEPFAVTVFRLTDRALEAGERLCRSWAERLRVCLDSDAWPAYSDAEVELDVPDDLELTFADDVPF